MIPLDKLRAVTHLVTHANCPDGVASALIVKDALPNVRVSFVKYGTAEHRMLEPEPGTLFCDFSPWLPKLTDPRGEIVCEDGRVATITDKGVLAAREDLIKAWRDAGVIVLDHHSRDVVEPYGELGVFGENERLECGAWLAYEHVWRPIMDDRPAHLLRVASIHVRQFAELAAVRDTWRQDDERFARAREQGELLLFWRMKQPLDYYLGLSDGCGALAERLFERAEEHARKSVGESCRFTSGKGTRVLVFQGVSATSDAAEICEKEAPGLGFTERWPNPGGLEPWHPELVVGFHYRTDAGRLQLQFSTRSHTGFDCQALARAHGGNGHRAAAGFTVEDAGRLSNPYEVFADLLNDWEEGLGKGP